MHHRRSTEKTRKVTPPSPSYMNNEQFAAYLANLRTNRVARPGGARPQPPSSSTRPARPSYEHAVSQPVPRSESPAVSTSSPADAPSGPNPLPTNASFSSRYSMSSSVSGRDNYPPRSTTPLKPSDVVPTATYMERGQRWMEKEEAVSLRQAMDDMRIGGETGSPSKEDALITKEGATDPQDEDARIYDAALNEASELVWQHKHGVVPNPHAPYRYKPHMRKNSYAHARTASVGRCGNDLGASGPARDATRSFSGSSTDSDGQSCRSRPSVTLSRDASGRDGKSPERLSLDSGTSGPSDAPRPAPHLSSSGRRRSSMKRNISGEVEKPFSGDQIWEEPEGASTQQAPESKPHTAPDIPLVDKPKNPQGQVRFAAAPPANRVAPWKPRSKVEIHRNPPSQSRNPQYTTNSSFTKPVIDDAVPKKNGMEIRSEEIRGATSMKLKDRSAKLPTPTAVSDQPGRPIVSFDSNWQAPEEKTDARPGSAFSNSESGATSQKKMPVEIPSIVVAPEVPSASGARRSPPVPSISIEGADELVGNIPVMPVIITPEDDTANSRPRPLPDPKVASRGRSYQRPQRHWSPAPGTGHRSATLCHECGLPIDGRFVSLAGLSERFHPQCFSCFACGTGLEALEISPEPDTHRKDRLDRIRRRAEGHILEETPGKTMAEDGDERLRFYCHLDWHELFAPRCKHCKTPILGEHVVALGEHWHYGHFFCAECGDPFEKGMTHIEKDGYAWCINCQTKRTERRAPKCKKCRCAVIGQYIRALGGEWHEECFRCASCNGGFDDGQIFPRETGNKTIVLCTRCRMIELKA